MKKLILFMILIPLFAYGEDKYTGERILKAAQKYGMTDSELNYLIDNTSPNLTLKDPQFGATALIHACVNNRLNMVKILIERGGANVDEVDKNGETCLIAAARKGNIEVVKILLGFGANPSIVGNLNKSAYDYAVDIGHTEVARLLGGPPKKKVSFKDIAGLVAGKKPGDSGAPKTSGLLSQKYLQDLGRISLIIKSMKPVPGTKGDVEKLNEIAKVTGFSDIVKKQIQAREQEEARLKLENENRRAKAKSAMIAKLKAVAAFNNLYFEVKSTKREPSAISEVTPKEEGQVSQPARSSEFSFSDAANQLMNDMDLKLKKKEDEINAEKQLDLERGAAERLKAIEALIYAGNKEKNIEALKNEPEEKLKEKVESIKDLLDVKESKESRWVSLKIAAKKVGIISAFKTPGKEFDDKIKKIELEEEQLKNKAILETAEANKRKQAELQKFEEVEKKDLISNVEDRARVAKYVKNTKKQLRPGQETPILTVEDDKLIDSKKMENFSGKPKIDYRLGTIQTRDFTIRLLNNRYCQIRKSSSGSGYVLYISSLIFSKVKPSKKNESIWFINLREKPAPENGGLKCDPKNCKDTPIYVTQNNTKRVLFLNNIFIQLGKEIKDNFEIYSSVPGNQTIKIPITGCKRIL